MKSREEIEKELGLFIEKYTINHKIRESHEKGSYLWDKFDQRIKNHLTAIRIFEWVLGYNAEQQFESK